MKSLSVTAGPLARRVAVSSVVVEEVANLLNLLLAAEGGAPELHDTNEQLSSPAESQLHALEEAV